MGRVQDAMRRAAVNGEAAPAPETTDEAASPAEAFPDEMVAAAEPDSAGETEELPEPDSEDVIYATALAEERADAAPTSHMSASVKAKVVVDDTINPGAREQYRRLAAALHRAQEGSGLKVVMIASAIAAEGKSLTAANLALTLSESYRRKVLLVDADLRRPALHKLFGIDRTEGLFEALEAVEEGPVTLCKLSSRLTLLPAGQPTPDPMGGLTSARMRWLLDEARERFDWIIVDTPPIGVLPDANLLAAMVDAALLVIQADATPYHLVQRAADAIGRERVLGAVLNRATEASGAAAYKYYRHYYGYHTAPPSAEEQT
jgi:protein-tyrosine kinase